jgi:hypothetical protein
MDTVTNKRLIVEYSGWMECDPEKTQFLYVGNDPFVRVVGGDDIFITGKEYMTLPPEEQGNFILHCLGETYMDSLDGELVHCDIEIDEI